MTEIVHFVLVYVLLFFIREHVYFFCRLCNFFFVFSSILIKEYKYDSLNNLIVLFCYNDVIIVKEKKTKKKHAFQNVIQF